MHGFSTSTRTLSSKTTGVSCRSRRGTSTSPRWSPPMWATTPAWWWTASRRAKFTARRRLWSSGQTVRRQSRRWRAAQRLGAASLFLFPLHEVALIIAQSSSALCPHCAWFAIDSPSANACKWAVATQCRPANKATQISSLLTLPSCDPRSSF